MNTKYRNNSYLAILGLIILFAASAQAQFQVPRPPVFFPAATCQAAPTVYIRNARYSDYSRYSKLSPSTVVGGSFIQITTNCMAWDGQIVVTLQDVARPTNGYGVTALRLTNVTRSGSTITAQVPNYPIYRNRTYHVGLFVYGQPWKTANPGQVTIH